MRQFQIVKKCPGEILNWKRLGREDQFIDTPLAFFRFPKEISHVGESPFTEASYTIVVVIHQKTIPLRKLFDSYRMAFQVTCLFLLQVQKKMDIKRAFFHRLSANPPEQLESAITLVHWAFSDNFRDINGVEPSSHTMHFLCAWAKCHTAWGVF